MTGAIILTVIVIALIAGAVSARGGKAANPRLRGYGVVIDGQQVKSQGKILGPLAGSAAQVTDGTSRHTLTRVMTVAGALTKKSTAYVVISFPDGLVHTRKLDGASAIRQGQVWAVKFNALAAAADRDTAAA